MEKNTQRVLEFLCDGAGRRMRKKATDPTSGRTTTTYYAYDTGGKVLAIYTRSCGGAPSATVAAAR